MRHKQIICTKTLTRSKRKKSCLIKEAELRSVGCCCMHFVSVKLKCYPASFRSSVHIWFLHLLKTLLNNAPASQSSQMAYVTGWSFSRNKIPRKQFPKYYFGKVTTNTAAHWEAQPLSFLHAHC